MVVQKKKYSKKLTFLAVSLLLSFCFVFFTCAHQSNEYNLDQLDKAPKPIQRDLPMYPFSAKSQLIKAKVKIKCLVDKEGIPQNIVVVECDPEGVRDVFSPPAVEAVKKWCFIPGEIGGKPVRTRIAFWLYFELDEQLR